MILVQCGVFERDGIVTADDVVCEMTTLSGGTVSVDPRCLMFAPQ